MKTKVRKIKLDDGTVAWESIDGKQYQTRSGAWKRNQKLEAKEEPQEEPPTATPTDPPNHETEEPTATEDDPDFSDPKWAQFDFGELPEGVQVIPAPLKKINRMATVPGGKVTKAMLKAEAETNHAVLKMGYRAGDLLMSKYGQAVTVDPELIISHTEEDYDFISSVTYAWMEDRGLSVAGVIGPGTMAIVCNGYWFGAPIAGIQKKAKKSLLRGAGNKLGGLKKFFRLPKFLRRRKTEETPNEESWTPEEGFEP